ncbi:unnamed protein product [Trypanosoma congolense IL3000]|uniref:WGS project CAEQ00000000 data, annotated contig 2301 n=1 Tax=Trypanosoma congolense (strain IL3000) TaxID=1068625 RepID=F9WD02_TRYCI|nr:unnamed protein product [Trypanosoma congolense IL3000]
MTISAVHILLIVLLFLNLSSLVLLVFALVRYVMARLHRNDEQENTREADTAVSRQHSVGNIAEHAGYYGEAAYSTRSAAEWPFDYAANVPQWVMQEMPPARLAALERGGMPHRDVRYCVPLPALLQGDGAAGRLNNANAYRSDINAVHTDVFYAAGPHRARPRYASCLGAMVGEATDISSSDGSSCDDDSVATQPARCYIAAVALRTPPTPLSDAASFPSSPDSDVLLSARR